MGPWWAKLAQDLSEEQLEKSQAAKGFTVGTKDCRFAFRGTDEHAIFHAPGWAEMSSLRS